MTLDGFLPARAAIARGLWLPLLILLQQVALAAPSSDPFPAPSSDFDAYREEIAGYLSANPLPGRSREAISLNLPFERRANPNAVYRGRFLLIHGLSDSPYVWHDMAESLTERGFDVRAILLPGHGTTPEDLLDISYRRWLQAARQHFELYDDGSTDIYLGGFSLGAVLATQLALENPHVSGMLLFSPAYRSKLDNYLRWSGLYKFFRPWLFGGMILEDNPIKYNSIPINSGTQFYKSTRYLQDSWGERTLSMPVLMILTAYDSVVNIDYVRKIFSQRFVSRHRKLLLYSNDDTLQLNQDEERRLGQYPDRRILNQSHLSLMNAPSNPLFGETGRVLVCNGNEYPVFMACMRATGHWYGAQHTVSPDGVPVARTTYNPDFDRVISAFDEVFQIDSSE